MASAIVVSELKAGPAPDGAVAPALGTTAAAGRGRAKGVSFARHLARAGAAPAGRSRAGRPAGDVEAGCAGTAPGTAPGTADAPAAQSTVGTRGAEEAVDGQSGQAATAAGAALGLARVGSAAGAVGCAGAMAAVTDDAAGVSPLGAVAEGIGQAAPGRLNAAWGAPPSASPAAAGQARQDPRLAAVGEGDGEAASAGAAAGRLAAAEAGPAGQAVDALAGDRAAGERPVSRVAGGAQGASEERGAGVAAGVRPVAAAAARFPLSGAPQEAATVAVATGAATARTPVDQMKGPAQQSAQGPAQQPAQQPAQRPAQQPAQRPAQQPAQQPAQESAPGLAQGLAVTATATAERPPGAPTAGIAMPAGQEGDGGRPAVVVLEGGAAPGSGAGDAAAVPFRHGGQGVSLPPAAQSPHQPGATRTDAPARLSARRERAGEATVLAAALGGGESEDVPAGGATRTGHASAGGGVAAEAAAVLRSAVSAARGAARHTASGPSNAGTAAAAPDAVTAGLFQTRYPVETAHVAGEIGRGGYDDLAGRISDHIVRFARLSGTRGGHATEVRLQLEPPSLGELRVRLVSSSGVVNAELVVKDDAARAAVEAGLPRLKEALAGHGVRMGSLTVDVGSNGSGAADGFAGQAGATWWPARPARLRAAEPAWTTAPVGGAGAQSRRTLPPWSSFEYVA